MSYQVLARKWRPRNFEQMVGQQHVVRALVNALDGDRVHHAFLFTGTRGVGKTTVARVLAKSLNCERGVTSAPCGECGACTEIDEGRFLDLIEVDAASRSKVDETRDLMDNVQFAPTRGRYKVYLIDEVHMFSDKSFNALLKTLEEPPPHVKFLLATTDPQKLPITVLSRCLQFNLKRLPAEVIAPHLRHIVDAEAIEADQPGLDLIARAADGSMRDALSLLDQAIAFGGGQLAASEVRAMLGTLDREHVQRLLGALAEGDGPAVLAAVERMAGDVTDYAEALVEVLSMLQRIAVAQQVPEALAEADDGAAACRELAGRMPAEDVQLFYQMGLHARRDLPLAPDPRGGFEMALLRMIAFRPAGGATGGARPARAGRAESESARPVVESARMSRVDAASAPAVGSANMSQADAPSAPAVEPAPATADADMPGDAPPSALTPDSWRATVEALGLGGLARELASNCVLLRAERGTVHLALAPSHGQLTAPGIRAKLESALGAYVGREVRVEFELQEPRGETPADGQRRDAVERHASAVQAVERDPGVRALCETFDTKVDAGLVRPVD